jgi:sec-independent protein translocase protein TatA
MFGLDSIWHWVLLLVIVLLFFGTGKLRYAGRDIGTAIGDLKKGMQEGASSGSVPKISADSQADDLGRGANEHRHDNR